MPQIGPDLWKAGLSFYWFREYLDGRVETEFDQDTGQMSLWGPRTPEGLKAVGWVPVTPGLASKMSLIGEIGYPVQAQAVITPVGPGDEVIIYKEVTVWNGWKVHCKVCNAIFRSRGNPEACPSCGSKISWKCSCGELSATKVCPACQKDARMIDPFEKGPHKWDEVEYFLGIKGKFLNRFSSTKLITEH